MFAVSALVLRPLVGRLCDTRGRRPLLVGGALLASMVLLLTARADGLGDLLVLRLVAGVAEAAVFVAAFAAVADLAPPGRMGEAISYNSLALYVGLAGGPPLAAEYLVESAPVVHGFGTAWAGARGAGRRGCPRVRGGGETRLPRRSWPAPPWSASLCCTAGACRWPSGSSPRSSRWADSWRSPG